MQIVGITGYISGKAELLGRQGMEQEIEPKREALEPKRYHKTKDRRGALPRLKLRYRSGRAEKCERQGEAPESRFDSVLP